MPIVIGPGLDAGAFCLLLRQNIKNMGSAKAFGDGDLVVLYSGPADYARGNVSTSITNNWARSKKQAERLDGRRIDDTEIGKYLAGLDLPTYFTGFYGKDWRAVEQAELEVWGCASVEFMKAKFRKVASAVCGAHPNRVFRKYEIGTVVKNRRVRLVNGRPMQLFKDFHKIDSDEAFRLFCITELLEARQRARTENTPEAWGDYHERRGFYLLERSYAVKIGPALSQAVKDEMKLQKRRALALYHLGALAVSAPAKPAARRPRVIKAGRAPS